MKTAVLAILIFIFSFFAFTVSARPFNTTDSYPNNLVAINWLLNKRLDLTNLKEPISERGIENILVTNSQGVSYPKTPVIIGIINIPGFFILDKWFHVTNLTDNEIVFSDYPQYAGKYLASLYCALSAVLLFLFFKKITKNTKSSFLSAITFAFATNIFSTASQANWQHGPSLLLISIIFLMSLAKKKTTMVLITLGIVTALLAVIRISNLFYYPFLFLLLKEETNPKFKILIYSLVVFLGISTSIGLSVFWNIPYGYNSAFITALKSVNIPIAFLNLISLLISPNVGLFVYSPILILSAVPIYKAIKIKNYSNYLKFLFPTIILFLLFTSVWPYWTGGTSLGARMLTELLPILCFSIAILLSKHRTRLVKFSFVTLFLISIFISLLTTFAIDGWWFRFYTKQTPQSQLSDAWYYKPTLFQYLLKTRIIYFEKLKKENGQLTLYTNMYRPNFKTLNIINIYSSKKTILD